MQITAGAPDNWGNISQLKLHTEDALFHTWRPNCRVHYVKSGVSGVPTFRAAPVGESCCSCGVE